MTEPERDMLGEIVEPIEEQASTPLWWIPGDGGPPRQLAPDEGRYNLEGWFVYTQYLQIGLLIAVLVTSLVFG